MKKLIAIIYLIILGFLPAIGEANAQAATTPPALKPAAVHPANPALRRHRRKHRRHLRRRRRRVRRHLRRHRSPTPPTPTAK